MNGTFNEWSNLNGAPEDIPYLLSRLDEYGGPNSYPNYAVGWAMAGSTPATWCINACQGGGQNQGMVIRWPKGFKAKGEIRRQYTHLIDVGPTILEAVGIPEPKIVNGVEQIPMAGVSMSYSFDDANAKDRHVTQYNECTGNRSIYHDGWMACVMHRAPWEEKPRVDDYAKDKWELYHVAEDFGQATDLAAQDAREAQGDAGPLPPGGDQVRRLSDGRPLLRAPERHERRAARHHGRPHGDDALPGHDRHGGERLHRHAQPVVSSSPPIWRFPKGGAEGVILSQGGLFGGWSLYVKDGKPKFAYNWLAREKYYIEGKEPLPEGKVTLVYDFTYDGGGLAQGRQGHALHQRQEGRRRPHREDAGSGLVPGRRHR